MMIDFVNMSYNLALITDLIRRIQCVYILTSTIIISILKKIFINLKHTLLCQHFGEERKLNTK